MVDQFSISDAAIVLREADAAWVTACERWDEHTSNRELNRECLRTEKARDEA